jgi:hypothetical protein
MHEKSAMRYASAGMNKRALRHVRRYVSFGGRIEELPDALLLRILEEADLEPTADMTSSHVAGLFGRMGGAATVARLLITYEWKPDAGSSRESKSRMTLMLPEEHMRLNVHRIVELVARGGQLTGRTLPCTCCNVYYSTRSECAAGDKKASVTRNAEALRDAILDAAREPTNPSHAAMLVRASFIRDVVESDEPHIHPHLKDAAETLFDAMRPWIVAAIRSERIGGEYPHRDADEEMMEFLVSSIGRSRGRDAGVGYARAAMVKRINSNTISAEIATYIERAPSMRDTSDGLFTGKGVDILKRHGPLSFWRTSHVTDLSNALDGVSLSADLYWDTSNVTKLNKTFANSSFRGKIGHWDTSRVTEAKDTFAQSATPLPAGVQSWSVWKRTGYRP